MSDVKANDRQVGGSHYHSKGLQHWDFVVNTVGDGYLVGCATKYVSRHRSKNGVEDLKKALHYCDKLEEVRQQDGWKSIEGTGSVLSSQVKFFAMDNSLTLMEELFCQTLVTAQNPQDIARAKSIVRHIIEVEYNGGR